MIKFHDYNPSKPFEVKGEWHYVDGGEVTLNYTPMQGSMKVLLDGVEAIECKTKSVEAGQFYIDYSAESEYKRATQKVYFSESDNGKRASFDYSGVSTLIFAKHFNEIRDFMNRYNEDRARELVKGNTVPRKNEAVELLSNPHLVDFLEIEVTGTKGNNINVNSTKDIVVGKTYTISDGEQYEEFEVDSIDEANNEIIAKELINNYESGHIYTSTATMSDGKAIVSGGVHTVKWDKSETWRGTTGHKESTVIPAISDGSTDGISVNKDGEFEVDNFDRHTVFFWEKKNSTTTETRVRSFNISNRFYAPVIASSNAIIVDEKGNLCPYSPRWYFGVGKKMVIKKALGNNSVLNLNAMYIPPIWYKVFPHPLNVNKKVAGFSLHEAEGATLLEAFNDAKEGFYILSSSQSISLTSLLSEATAFKTLSSDCKLKAAVIYCSSIAGSNPDNFSIALGCPTSTQSASFDGKDFLFYNDTNFNQFRATGGSLAGYFSVYFGRNDGYCAYISKATAEKLQKEGENL